MASVPTSFNEAIRNFDQRRLRQTTVQVRTSDGRAKITDRYDNQLSTISGRHFNDDISRYGFISNPSPDLQVAQVSTDDLTLCFGSQDVAGDLNTLQQHGITHIINLVSSYVPNYFPNCFEYLSLNVRDDLNYNLHSAINACFDFINRRVLPQGGKTFIHCNAGVSRAPCIVIASLIRKCGLSYDDAYNLVANARNISPNLNFKMQLRALAAENP
ncbi:unnamed protein product [Dibothriocephalus latus]|uniref:Tyrosine-protein phosphatase domain-containing protein n=1 Tax=Dibothriocephalus latus TaxID=60516 RepID=A0A3P7MGY3_DIBLA|nr:unnamed protein product [Dibothriocephalus latus]